MNSSLPTIVNPYAPPDVDDGVSSTRLHKWRPLLSLVVFFIGSMIGLNVGSAISEGLGATIHKSAVNIPAAVECELVLTRLFSRMSSNGADHANKDSQIAPN